MSAPVVIIGGGPAGLKAAEVLAQAGQAVTVYERKPSPGRKFLMAGRGGLNLTHSEDLGIFLTRYGVAQDHLAPVINSFTPSDLKTWCEKLGQETFIGSSGRVFPKSMKASPLLRAWIERLNSLGVRFYLRHEWEGWNSAGDLAFKTADGSEKTVKAPATLLALGGASWPDLGSNGKWTDILQKKSISLSPLLPSNCGFTVPWTEIFRNKFAGMPLKPVTVTFAGKAVPGEIMVTEKGIEGGAVYALSSAIRDAVLTSGEAMLTLDLQPHLTHDALMKKVKGAQGRNSLSTYLQKTWGLNPIIISLLRETDRDLQNRSIEDIASLLKALPLKVYAPFSIDRAISTAGGIRFEALDDNFMLKALPGTFAAGEMLDWEAPTGGYLLQGCFATGHAAGEGILKWLGRA